MIKYKRIYPLRQGGRLCAIVTVIGSDGYSDIHVKFKIKPKEKDLYLILFDPRDYKYEMLPIKEKMSLNFSVTHFTACVIACKNGMFIEFLMEGSINRSKINTARLKSIIAMDMHEKYDMYIPVKESCPHDDTKTNDKSCDYMETQEVQTLDVQTDVEAKECGNEPVISVEATEECSDKTASDETPLQECTDISHNKELMDYLKEIEEKHLPLSFAPEEPPAKTEADADACGAAEKIIREYNIAVPDVNTKINIPKEISDVSGKYCEFINPFKGRWDGIWWKVQYPDKQWHYIVGRIQVDGSSVSALGVPGNRGQKPACLESCDMYAIADNGVGYWLMFQK